MDNKFLFSIKGTKDSRNLGCGNIEKDKKDLIHPTHVIILPCVSQIGQSLIHAQYNNFNLYWALKQGPCTCSKFKVFNLSYLHVLLSLRYLVSFVE